MSRRLEIAVIALCACTREHPPAPRPALAPPPGVIAGHATATGSGGAERVDRPGVWDETKPCTIRAVGLDARVRETRSDGQGAYALEVPPGPYVVSFEDCGGDPGNGDPPPVQRTLVRAGARVTVDFHGMYSYK